MRVNDLFIQLTIVRKLIQLNRDESGQGMVEYVLMLMLVAVALIGAFAPVANALIRLIGKIVAAFG
jgi:Flp pilus assembly pilin Flp